MRRTSFITSSTALAVALAMTACMKNSADDSAGRVPSDLKKQIVLGEKLFAEKKCGECHSTTGEFANTEKQGRDLASVFLAMDTLFVKSHLQFAELTAMPPIAMTPHEISAITQYVGVLHAQANMDKSLKDHDGICPVCGAPLMISEAMANHLKVAYQGTDYYFECPDCKVVFQRDPAWHSQSGYLQTEHGVRTFIE